MLPFMCSFFLFYIETKGEKSVNAMISPWMSMREGSFLFDSKDTAARTSSHIPALCTLSKLFSPFYLIEVQDG